jgi:uncharacterized protein YdhG (YjbR/CyaY superfamily)
MAKVEFESVEGYIAAQPAAAQGVLRAVHGAIRKAVPGAEESISYGIPTYKLQGARLIYFAGWKRHYSIYPATGRLVAAFRKELAPYEVAKGTIRFSLSERVPVKLISAIAKFLAKDIAYRRGQKKAPR